MLPQPSIAEPRLTAMWASWGRPQLLLLLVLAVTRGTVGDTSREPKVFQPMSWMPPVRACPENCELLFLKLEEGAEGEGKVQHVDMQQRGERESGTSVMFAWGTDLLGQSCMYLQRAYGRMSCRIEFTEHTRTLIFEPGLGRADEEKPPQCRCETISSVTINITSENKHRLPCDDSCPWSRGPGVARPTEPVCRFSNERLPKDSAELMGCMHQAACPVTDNRLQMAVFRDPRAVAASSFLTFSREYPHLLEKAEITTAEEFFLAVLPTVCKWTTVRYKLFAQILAAQSTVYWYSDTLAAPLPWHYNLLWYFGLSMPAAVVEWASHVASKGSPALVPTEGVDNVHGARGIAPNETFRDEVSAESLLAADEVLRVWLPPALLEKLEIPEA